MEPKPFVVKPSEVPEYESFNYPRKETPLIDAATCGAKDLTINLFKLPPGEISRNGIHAVDEVYYVISGRARIVMGGESHQIEPPPDGRARKVVGGETFYVEPGMVVYIPKNVRHQSTNLGDDELVYLVVFAPPAGVPQYWEYEPDNWIRHDPKKS
jgi:mannose-6-phosphate isomerase-like protein (cupin superfamily)